MAKKLSLVDDEIETIAQRIIEDVEHASSKDLSDAEYTKKILQLSDLRHTKQLLQEIESANAGSVCSIEKKAVIKALLLSTWLQRLYFIIRSALMSILGAVVTLLYVSFFGEIGAVLAVVMGILIFIIGLIVTRLFDTQIIKVTKNIVRRLGNHEKLREFIMNHF